MAFILARNQRIYLQNQTAIAVIPNTTGTATVANANCVRHSKGKVDVHTGTIMRTDKTGTRHNTIGVKGREYCTWEFGANLAGSGAAGTAPDCEPILQALFGQAPTVSAGVSRTFAMVDTPWTGFTMYSFRTPSTAAQEVAFGCVVKTATFNFNEQGAANWSASGDALYSLDNNFFSSATAAEKGGLTAFPTEPSAPVTNGNIVPGFLGSVTINAGTTFSLKGGTLTINRNDTAVRDNFGEITPTSVEGDEMMVTLAVTLDDDDTTIMKNLKAAQRNQTAIAATFVLGTSAGNIWTFTVNNIQLQDFTYDDAQRRYRVSFGASRAYATSLTATDPVALVLT